MLGVENVKRNMVILFFLKIQLFKITINDAEVEASFPIPLQMLLFKLNIFHLYSDTDFSSSC